MNQNPQIKILFANSPRFINLQSYDRVLDRKLPGDERMSKYDASQHSKAENDNRSNQMNPNNDAYWSSRGYEVEEEEEYYDEEDD